MKYFLVLALFLLPFAHAKEARPNILIITVDDMSADSLGCFGSKLKDTSPRTDQLARESLRFQHAHVCVANCYPSRNVMFSGLYPHNNGVEGFYPIENKYPTLCDILQSNGYYTGIRGKVTHSTPYHPYPGWDHDLTIAPDGSKYHIKDVPSYGTSTATGIAHAKKANKPFFLNINISDPHKPFWKPGDQTKHPASKTFKADEVPIPGFLFDHPKVREELALYYSSVRRADDAVGSILDALKKSGEYDNTITIFLSDHGMPLPFAKTALWHHSTHTPLLIRVPGLTKPGTVEKDHMVSAVDLTPTCMDLLGLYHRPEQYDGWSFVPVMLGKKQGNRDAVFKVYNENSGAGRHPMRAVQTKDYLYLWNPWSDGTNKFKTATTGTASYRTMRQVAETNPNIAKRLHLFDHRVPEELYHVASDPDCLVNLIDSPDHTKALSALQKRMEKFMRNSKDHALEAFRNRTDPKAGPAYTAIKQAEANERRANKKKNKNPRKKAPPKNKAPQKNKNAKLISLAPPKTATPGNDIALIISHTLPVDLKTQELHVTLKTGKKPKRLERKVISIKGNGTTKVTFTLPAEIPDNLISFSAFVGSDYQSNFHHVSTKSISTQK